LQEGNSIGSRGPLREFNCPGRAVPEAMQWFPGRSWRTRLRFWWKCLPIHLRNEATHLRVWMNELTASTQSKLPIVIITMELWLCVFYYKMIVTKIDKAWWGHQRNTARRRVIARRCAGRHPRPFVALMDTFTLAAVKWKWKTAGNLFVIHHLINLSSNTKWDFELSFNKGNTSLKFPSLIAFPRSERLPTVRPIAKALLNKKFAARMATFTRVLANFEC